MARPNPVPPYLRLVPASACWNASKMSFCFSGAIPSRIEIASQTVCDRLNTGCSSVQPAVASDIHGHVPMGGELEGVRQRF
jgi:hypothetical protein